MPRVSRLILAASILSLGPWAAPRASMAKDGDPTTPAEAIAIARPLLDEARKAKPGESKETAVSVRRAIDALKSQSKDGFKLAGAKLIEFESLWNEAITVGVYHGVKRSPNTGPARTGASKRLLISPRASAVA